ncbi:MAG: YgfZ/GcvT domain-containing protein [Candidatus Polarisedimenticolia bacterium]
MDPRGAIDPAAAYRAAHDGAVVVTRTDRERLLFRGKDALDLLHRLTTNDLKGLRPGEGAAAVFTTPKGRILDLVLFHRLPEGVLAITGPGRARPVAGWVERYTFREEVGVEDWTAGHATLGIFGTRAPQAVAAAFGGEAAVLPLHHLLPVAIGAATGWLTRTWPLAGGGYHLTAPTGSIEPLRGALLSHPAAVPADAGELEALRIETGLPEQGSELNEERNPWEACLDDAISLDKGCYVGQEVVARLNTYRKVARLLVRIDLPGGPAPPRGAVVRRGDEAIGEVTSAALLPGTGRAAALAYVRDEDAVAATPVALSWNGGAAAGTIAGRAR